MRAVDTNILVYADREEAPQHHLALDLLRRLASGPDSWVLPWPCVYEFLRVVTHPRLFRPPTPPLEAWEAIASLLASPSLVLISEGQRHAMILDDLLRASGVAGNLMYDAHVAALLLEHGVEEILTADEDFRRFPGLKVTNPFRA